ncbi:MAG: aspartate aminotransferase family protein [Bacillota bacterium]|nr:MAG: aspartate aminotransferase family protein [Bacillota bacterium]
MIEPPTRNLARIHPFRNLLVSRAEGCWYFDAEGQRHLDLLAGCWSTVLGHNHPEFTESMRRQVGRLTHLGTGLLSAEVLDGAAELLSTVRSITGSDQTVGYKVAFLNTGSEAVDLAVKFAKAATGRREIVSLERGYYGAGTATYYLSGLPKKDFMGVPAGCYKLLGPDCARCPVGMRFPGCDYACVAVSEQLLDASSAGDVAAILFEPVAAAGGMLFPPPGYLRRLAELARRRGALLIADEVSTGGGRTARWFACEHEDVAPDVIAFGKAFGNGLPVSGVLLRDGLEEAAYSRGLTHIQSHQSDPLGAFAVATVIGLIRRDGLLDRVSSVGRLLLERLAEISRATGAIEDVRGLGLMTAFSATSAEAGESLHRVLTAERVVVGYQPSFATFQLMPAYTLSEEEIDHFCRALSLAARG